MEVNEFIDRFVKDPGLNSILKGFAGQFTEHKSRSDSRSDDDIVIGKIVRECHANAFGKGFWSGRHPAEAIALIHSELSELLEAFRCEKPPFDKFEVMSEKKELGNIPLAMEELADVAIRVFDMAGRYFDSEQFARVILNKMNYNITRPFKHGKSF